MKTRPMPEPFHKITPGEHLRFALEDSEMDFADFARRAGLAPERVAAILADEIAPAVEDADAMARVWGENVNVWRGAFGLPKAAPPRKADKNVMFWTTAEKKEQIRACASAHNLSISAFILQCVDAALEADAPPPPRKAAAAALV